MERGEDETSSYQPLRESRDEPSAVTDYPDRKRHSRRAIPWLFVLELLLQIALLVGLLSFGGLYLSPLLGGHAVLLGGQLLVAGLMLGLLYDPWHNCLVQAFRIHQALLLFSALLLCTVMSLLAARGAPAQEAYEASTGLTSLFLVPPEPQKSHRGLLIGVTLGWGAVTVIATWACCLLRQDFDVALGSGCCPVVRCRACRITFFMSLPRPSCSHNCSGGDVLSYRRSHSDSGAAPLRPRALSLPEVTRRDRGVDALVEPEADIAQKLSPSNRASLNESVFRSSPLSISLTGSFTPSVLTAQLMAVRATGLTPLDDQKTPRVYI